ncbi:MAG: alanine--glyoxylate aminotransferase family protein [Planctomycetes bacterium]|nr:alanine--glyoxylate aminotransferase family protein [Planctomycetota bacterium]
MKIWIPGPTHVRSEILEEQTRAMIGHRSKAMSELIERIDPPLRLAFGLASGSSATVAVGNHSATAMMEGALLGVGPRVLSVVNGSFSKRWAEIGKLLEKDVSVLEFPWGQAVTQVQLEEALKTALKAQRPFDAVTLVVCETSTGVLTPLAPVAKALRSSPETLLLVDVVSAIAGSPLDFDAHGLDFALAGVNKALALPPGITVMCASKRYLDGARTKKRMSWYLDPIRTIDGHVERKTPATPVVTLYRALARQLEDITKGVTLPARDQGKTGAAAWSARFEKHARLRQATLAWAARHGLAPFPPEPLSSPTVSCITAGGLDVAALIDALKKKGHEIGNGYDKLKGQTFRIGHMGDHTEQGLAELLQAMDEVFDSVRVRA